MPFDGKTFTETRLEPFSLGDLIAWLQTQDPATKYYPAVPDECLWARYTVGRGGHLGDHSYHIGERWLSADLPDGGWQERIAYRFKSYDFSYGAALSRALALQAAP